MLRTVHLTEMYDNDFECISEVSMKRVGIDYSDIYQLHNPMDVDHWTLGQIPLLRTSKVKNVAVSNHCILELQRSSESLGQAGFRVSAVQNHFSLLHRSSECDDMLDYFMKNGSYMVLEQDVLVGRFSPQNPIPTESDRGSKYNLDLPQLKALTDEMTSIGKKQDASCQHVCIAWAIAKGMMSIVGATKGHHLTEAAADAKIELSADKVQRLETLADATDTDTRSDWKHTMES